MGFFDDVRCDVLPPGDRVRGLLDVGNPPALPVPTRLEAGGLLPVLIRQAGVAAEIAWDEFFQAEIANPHTRKNYGHAVRRFLTWAEERGLELVRLTPGQVGQYVQDLPLALPTRKLHLAALRRCFDRLVNRHVMVLNPALTVRTGRYSVVEGKTPQILPDQVRTLLASIDTSTAVGLRDLGLLSVLVYTAARVGAVAGLSRASLQHDGVQYTLRFIEKGGKSREIPVRHDLERILVRYLAAAHITDGPLFRTAAGKTGRLTGRPMTAMDICRMMKRRLAAAGLPARYSPHSFRVATVTNLLEQNASLEDVQNLAGHADPRTTRLYDRRGRKVTRNLVERITL
jgi:site-specific recombinase XerD